jgi:hypothetical protein
VDYLGKFPVGVVRSGSRILAFASLVGSAGKAELSIELVRYIERADRHLRFRARRGDPVGEGPSLPKRKPWLGAAAGAGPSGHGVALEPVWSPSVPPRRTLLGLQRIAPSQGQVCSTLGPALCQLPARSRFSSRDPGFGKTDDWQFPGTSCSKSVNFACFGIRSAMHLIAWATFRFSRNWASVSCRSPTTPKT